MVLLTRHLFGFVSELDQETCINLRFSERRSGGSQL